MAKTVTSRDKLSASFVESYFKDFSEHKDSIIAQLREKNIERYAELGAKLIASADDQDDETDFKSAKTLTEVAQKLLKTVGCSKPTKRQLKAAMVANDQFVNKLQKIAGVTVKQEADVAIRSEHEEKLMLQHVFGET